MLPVPHIVQLETIGFADLDFTITVAEVQKQVPFAIERVYWLTGRSRQVRRGNHAHTNSQQLLVAMANRVEVWLTDRQGREKQFVLDADGNALYVPPDHWLVLDMPEQAVLLCLSSHRFTDQVTLYDYDQFIRGL